MRLAEKYATATAEEIEAALAGGKLVLYSTGRPPTADHAITRSAALAEYCFAAPAFSAETEGVKSPVFAENPVTPTGVGTPGWARAFAADGVVVADFSVGPGATEIKLSGVSATPGFPLKIESLAISLPAETVEWAKTDFGHVFVTNADNPYRRLSVRG